MASVVPTTTEAGRTLLINPEPDPEYGNTAVHRDATGGLRSRRITAERPAMSWERVCVPHAATCAADRGKQRDSRQPSNVGGGDGRARPAVETRSATRGCSAGWCGVPRRLPAPQAPVIYGWGAGWWPKEVRR